MIIQYVVSCSEKFAYGKSWYLFALEDGQLSFITNWMWDLETCNRLLNDADNLL